jgi:protein-S-isoprenylcysteine O-methyltransferase Ste14
MKTLVIQHEALVKTRFWRRDSLLHVLSTGIPVTLLTVFAVAHIRHWADNGDFTGLGFALQETVLIILFLIRRAPMESSNTFGAWLAAIVGTWGVLLLRPTGFSLFGLDDVYAGLQMLGACLTIVGAAFLGRSFGIVAANRGVKTDGAYRIVRHPIYASYLFGFAGYFLSAVSIWNAAVLALTMAFQIRRIHAEERVLRNDSVYVAYADRVRYRLIPFVY